MKQEISYKTGRVRYLIAYAIIVLGYVGGLYGCQEFFNYYDLAYVPTFSLPALVLPDRGFRFDALKTKWFLWGYMEPVFDRQGGCKERHKVYANNEFLALAQFGSECNIGNIRAIISAEPSTISKCGYPLLFSTGYTANAISELLNSYPPLDLWTELSGSYVYQSSHSLVYAYFGLPGAPVINLLPEQRIAEFFMPTGSIVHRYMTSTDIVYGTFNAGLRAYGLMLEGSVFTGKAQDERYKKIKKPHFDSYALRLSYCSGDRFSAQMSYGHIKDNSPIELFLRDKRFIASMSYNLVGEDYLWTITGAYAHNRYCPGEDLNSALLETCFIKNDTHIVFGRYEYVQTDAPLAYKSREDHPNMRYYVQKVGLGYRYQFQPLLHSLWSIGASGDISLVPKNLKDVYGNHPFSWYLFLRIDLA